MEPWLVFAALGVLFALAEVFTPTFFALPAGVAFLVAALIASFLPGWTPSLAVLAVLLLVTYGLSYKLVWPRFQKPKTRTGADGLVGKIAEVTEEITLEGGVGYVKLYGDSWRAISEHSFRVGDKVEILATEGNKVVVGPIHK